MPEGALVEPDAEHAVPGAAAAEEVKVPVRVSFTPPRTSLSHMRCLKVRVTLPDGGRAEKEAAVVAAVAKPV